QSKYKQDKTRKEKKRYGSEQKSRKQNGKHLTQNFHAGSAVDSLGLLKCPIQMGWYFLNGTVEKHGFVNNFRIDLHSRLSQAKLAQEFSIISSDHPGQSRKIASSSHGKKSVCPAA